MVAGSSVIICHGVMRQCSPLSESGAPSNNRRGAISLSLTLDDSSPPSSIRNTASVCAPALRLKVMTGPWCSPVLRATQNFGYYTSPASQKTPVARAQPRAIGLVATEQEKENNAIAHGRYNPEVKTHSLSGIFLARLMWLNKNRRIGRKFVKKYKSHALVHEMRRLQIVQQ